MSNWYRQGHLLLGNNTVLYTGNALKFSKSYYVQYLILFLKIYMKLDMLILEKLIRLGISWQEMIKR